MALPFRIYTFSPRDNLTMSRVFRVFRALGAYTATLDLGGIGRVALW